MKSPPVKNSPEDEEWKSVWAAVASMEGLLSFSLYITTDYEYQPDWSRNESRFLEDLKQITRPRDVRVSVDWPKGIPLTLPWEISHRERWVSDPGVLVPECA